MGRIRGKRPSPAMVVAIAALMVALGGTAAAGVATISVFNKKEKKQTRKIATNEINKAAPGLAVGSAQTAQNASNAENAGNADRLDGVDSGEFAKTLARTVDLADENAETDLLTLPGFGLLRAGAGACETESGNQSFGLTYVNTLSVTVDTWSQTPLAVGGLPVAPGDDVSSGFDDDRVSIVLRIRPQDSAGRAATVSLFSTNSGASCRVSMQAVLTG